MMRVVLDTNIFISGIFWEGNYCSQIIDTWRAGKIMLVSSLEMVQEFLETIRDFKIEMPEAMIQEWRTMIVENSVMVVSTEKLDIVKNDPKDNKFFEAAVVGKAEYIVSQDKKHVLAIPEFRGIKTIHPEEFVKLVD
ncbi:MAG: putative toxin-antitoxin system toxin component, PIN family [Candidatus Nanoarchaeia archaeon]|jgi:putative PIN family toxin of toxin-antitoxin system|nr:putative toxin-antitoxin system toxin component, PIN family [Candidatus Nanoarchaeia archaeon]|tara:strand:- start:205 stop:615 length:411 start_codon:yes stop_codon:yes gene_type:complete